MLSYWHNGYLYFRERHRNSYVKEESCSETAKNNKIQQHNVSTIIYIITLVVICLLCKTLEFILGFVLLFDFVSLVRIVESVMRNVKALSSAT